MGLFSENNLPEQGVKDMHEHEHEEIKIRTHVNKICSLWLAVSDCLFEIFLYFWTSDLQYFLESDLYFIQICIFWFVTNRFKIWSFCDVSCHIALECLFDKHMAHLNYSFKFGHEMLSLTYLATRWHHLRELQSWPPDGTTRISYKFAHQMAPQRTRFVLTES